MKAYFTARPILWSALFLILAILVPIYTAQSQQADSSPREIMRLGRGTANTLAWRPDGQVLAVGSGTGIWFYNRDFKPLNHVDDHSTELPYQLAWSPDGSKLAASYYNKVEIWEVPTVVEESEINLLRSIDSTGDHLQWHPDGNSVSIIEGVLNLANGEITSTHKIEFLINSEAETPYEIHDSGKVWWSPDGKRVVGKAISWPSSSGKFGIFDTIRGERLVILEGPIDVSTDFQWTKDASRVTNGGTIWDTTTGEVVAEFYGVGPVTSTFIWIESQNKIVSLIFPIGTRSSILAIWDVSTGLKLHEQIFVDNITDISLVPDTDDTLTAVTSLGFILDIDIGTFQVSSDAKPHNYAGNLTWSPDSQCISSSGLSPFDHPLVEIWRVQPQNDTLEPSLYLNQDLYPDHYLQLDDDWIDVDTIWSEDSQEIISRSSNLPYLRENYVIERWSIPSGQSKGRLVEKLSDDSNFFIPFFVPSPDFSKYATFSWLAAHDPRLHIFEWNATEPLLSLETPDLLWVYWSPDGTKLVTVANLSATNSIGTMIWDASTGALITSFKSNHSANEWSPDGRFLATGNTVYETDHWQSHLSLEQVVDLEWSPDSQLLLVLTQEDISHEAALTFWDIASGKSKDVISVPYQYITSMAWSPDGTMLAIGMRDGTIRIWDVADLTQN